MKIYGCYFRSVLDSDGSYFPMQFQADSFLLNPFGSSMNADDNDKYTTVK